MTESAPKMHLDTAISTWLAVLQYQRSPETVSRYSGVIADFATFAAATCAQRTGNPSSRDPLIIELDIDLLDSYVAHTISRPSARGGTLSPASIKLTYAVLTSFFRFLEQRRMIEASPMRAVPLPRLRQAAQGEYSYLEPDELMQLYLYARDGSADEGRRHKRPGTRRREDALLIALLGWCGLRVGEVCALDKGSVRSGDLYVYGKGAKERIVPIVEPHLIEALEAHDPPPGKHLLSMVRDRSKRLTRNAAELRVKALGKAAGVGDIHPHTLRHSYATEVSRSSSNNPTILRDLLGHSSVITGDTYRHASSNERREAMERAAHARR